MKKTKLFREELANEYASKKLEKPEDACWPIDEYINFYKQNLTYFIKSGFWRELVIISYNIMTTEKKGCKFFSGE